MNVIPLLAWPNGQAQPSSFVGMGSIPIQVARVLNGCPHIYNFMIEVSSKNSLSHCLLVFA
jgi:hypothetical protein